MNKNILVIAIILSGLFFNALLFAGGRQDTKDNTGKTNVIPDIPTVELIYLNHGPVRNIVTDIDNLLEGYGEKIQIIQFTFGSPEGESFAESRKLDGHIPLAVFIDGSMDFTLDDRSIEFISFPQGGGTGFVADGEWSIDDLKQIIDGILEQN